MNKDGKVKVARWWWSSYYKRSRADSDPWTPVIGLNLSLELHLVLKNRNVCYNYFHFLKKDFQRFIWSKNMSICGENGDEN